MKTSILLSRLYSADDTPLVPRRFTVEDRRKKGKDSNKLMAGLTTSPDMRIIRDVEDDSLASDALRSPPSDSLYK